MLEIVIPWRESDKPTDPTKAFVPRPEVTPPPPIINEPAATTMAIVAAKALKVDEREIPLLRDQYARFGKIEEYNRLSALTANVTDVNQARAAAAAIQRSVAENKIDLSQFSSRKVDSRIKEILDKHEADRIMMNKNPVATDRVQQLQAEPGSPYADDGDADLALSSPLMTADHVRYAISHGSNARKLLHEMFPDQVDKPVWIKDFVQGIFTGWQLIPQAAAINKELELGLEGGRQLVFGEVIEAVQQQIIKSPPAQQRVIYQRFQKAVLENPAFFSDYGVFAAYDELLSPEFLASTGTRGPWGDAMSDLMPFIDATGVPGTKMLTGAFWKLVKAPALKVAAKVNPTSAMDEVVAALRARPDEVRAKYDVSQVTIARTQLPTLPSEQINNIPDVAGAMEEAERMAALQKVILNKVDELDSELVPVNSKVAAIEQTVDQINALNNGKVLPGKTMITPYTDGTGYQLSFMLGQRADKGFATLGAAKRAAERALERAAGKSATIWTTSGDDIVPMMTLQELAEEGPRALKAKGNFYVSVTDQYVYSEMDHILSAGGNALEMSKGWLGRARGFVSNPSGWFDRAAYKQYLRRFSAQSGLTANLDAIITPYTKLSIRSKWRVNDALEWSADFGIRMGRNPTIKEVQEQFGYSLTDKEVTGLYNIRVYHDTLYALENGRVFRHLDARGGKTIRSRDGKIAYHGIPYKSAAKAKDVTRAYDPATNQIVDLNRTSIEALYKDGGRVIKMDIAPALRGTDEVTHHAVFNPKTSKGWEYGELSRTPLKYIPGYYPRMYADPYIITQTMPEVMVDGKLGKHSKAIHTASSRKEAEELIQHLTELNASKKWTYSIGQDVRLSSLDQTAANAELMRMEGRLFYDERNVDRLLHASGKPADVIAPINTIARSARMVARQVSLEDFNTHMVDLWQKTYGSVLRAEAKKVGLREVADINTSLMSVDEALSKLTRLANEPGKLGKVARDALESFRYIQMMRGAMDMSSNVLRSKLISLGEFLYDTGILGKSLGTDAARELWRFSPSQLARELTFFRFIVANPIKQFVLNAQQHMFLLSLDPAYIGRWQLDTSMLLLGARMRTKSFAGLRKFSDSAANAHALAMRLTRAEYDLLVERFTSSGLMNNVNIRAALGDIPSEAANVPMTKVGAVADKAWGIASARWARRRAEEYGFDLGEQVNLAASYLPALRAVMRKYKVKGLQDLTPSQWSEVTTTALDYSSAMIRPNASRYQQGILALPLQFLQFQHKTFLTMVGMNKAFTKKQALQLTLGQFILFGGDMLGLGTEVEKGLSEIGVEDPTLVDIISGGLVDWTLDQSLQAVFRDEGINLDWSLFLSPTSGVSRLVKNAIDMAFETAPLQTFVGVSGYGASKVFEAFSMANRLLNAPEGMSWDENKVNNILDAIAAGALSGYSQAQQAIVARKLGYWQAANGEVSSIKARTTELVLRGSLGVSPEEFRIQYDLTKAIKGDSGLDYDNIKDSQSDARKYYNDVRTMVNRYGDGVFSHDYYLAQSELLKELILGTRDEREKGLIQNEFLAIVDAEREQKDSLSDSIHKAVKAGGTVQEWMITKIKNHPGLSNEEQLEVIKFFEDTLRDAEEQTALMQQNIDTDVDAFKPNVE
jgi:hypothetical protein